MDQISKILKYIIGIFSWEKLEVLPEGVLEKEKKIGFFKMVLASENLPELNPALGKTAAEIQPGLAKIVFSSEELPVLDIQEFTEKGDLLKVLF
jgi:hypothetical protein